MERHGLDEQQAFERLRDHARRRGRRLVDVAQAVCDGHLLLVKPPDPPTERARCGGGSTDWSMGRIRGSTST
jgi:hypothetical protein